MGLVHSISSAAEAMRGQHDLPVHSASLDNVKCWGQTKQAHGDTPLDPNTQAEAEGCLKSRASMDCKGTLREGGEKR